jgi:hypothetical protein
MQRDKESDQIGACDICQRRTLVRRVSGSRVLCNDHDHGNGKWRGFLCSDCNIGLGWFKDDPKRLRRAVEYVSYWNTVHYRPEDTDVTFDEWAAFGERRSQAEK